MTRPRAGSRLPLWAASCALLAAAGWWASPAAAAGPAAPAHAPEWVALRQRFAEARAARRAARWGGSLPEVVAALEREAEAESSYLDAVAAWLRGGERPAAARAETRLAALDALEAGRESLGHRILDGPLRDDREFLPLRARELGASGEADSGLALLGWPADRRPSRGAGIVRRAAAPVSPSDEAALFVANALSDSLGDRRAARSALWALLGSDPSVASRREARLRLARSLLEDAMPRLALATVAPEEETGGDAALLAADARAGAGDTLDGATRLALIAAPRGLSTADRHALATRAAAWLRGARADSVSEGAWMGLVTALGELGEPEAGLALLRARGRPAPDSAAALVRAEAEASLLGRAKKNDAAAGAYRALLARASLPAPDRARYALGLARALRGAGRFAPMDSAFTNAVALDPGGSAAETAAWERAREWEDRRTPREAAGIYAWARPLVRSPSFAGGVRVHGALAWLRAGAPDSARAFLTAPGATTGDAQFWLGRVALSQADTATARAAFREAWRLSPWSYEGIRAAEELRAAGAWPADSVPFRAERPDPVPRGEGAESPLRVRLLEAIDLLPLAIESLRDCARGQAPDDRVCADALEEHGLFRSVRPARNGVDRARWDFPPAYALEIFAASARETLDPAMLWAIMRQESAYDRTVRSKAGALGLLQLVPATASRLAGHAITADSLVHADVNVRLGARYVRDLTAEMKDPRAILAAYNAGEDVVRRWLRDRGVVDDEWVELIPYRETRDYVKQVYANWRRYEALYQGGDGSPAP
ncbi:MAG TPA: lytic transglycosylase domain-containing protein [Candidatus Eisenbacteria bacterium]